MFLQFLIPLVCAVCVIRTVSFSINCFKEKNVIGGISVALLSAVSVGSLLWVL